MDENFQQAYSAKEIEIALKNVLTLAEERAEQIPPFEQADKIISRDSIRTVRDYFLHSGEAIINNLHIAKENRG